MTCCAHCRCDQPATLPLEVHMQAWRWNLLRDWLELLSALRQLHEPVTSPAGLRQVLEFLLHLAETAGVEQPWIERLQQALDDPALFDVLLSLVRLAAARLTPRQAA